jgi:hypothetical protein
MLRGFVFRAKDLQARFSPRFRHGRIRAEVRSANFIEDFLDFTEFSEFPAPSA